MAYILIKYNYVNYVLGTVGVTEMIKEETQSLHLLKGRFLKSA